jgi:hypothetical protein
VYVAGPATTEPARAIRAQLSRATRSQAVGLFATLTSELDELQRIKAHLADLGRSKPTAKRRAEVEALLQSKWQGVQVSAAHVLATWGGPESVSALRRWLSKGGLAREAIRALGRCVGDDDVEWALDLYFRSPPLRRGFGQSSGLLFWPLVIGLPRSPTLTRLRREATQASPNREAAKIALRWISQHDHWLKEHSQSKSADNQRD